MASLLPLLGAATVPGSKANPGLFKRCPWLGWIMDDGLRRTTNCANCMRCTAETSSHSNPTAPASGRPTFFSWAPTRTERGLKSHHFYGSLPAERRCCHRTLHCVFTLHERLAVPHLRHKVFVLVQYSIQRPRRPQEHAHRPIPEVQNLSEVSDALNNCPKGPFYSALSLTIHAIHRRRSFDAWNAQPPGKSIPPCVVAVPPCVEQVPPES